MKDLLSIIDESLQEVGERLGQRHASKIIRDGIALWDGSLTGGTIDTPLELLKNQLN